MHPTEERYVPNTPNQDKYNCFAVTAPGLAPLCANELVHGEFRRSRAAPITEAGGVTFRGDRAALYRANLHLRTASRVLVRLGEFRAENFDQLRARAGKLSWERCLTPGQAVDLRVTCHKSRLYHSGAVAERVAYAIEDRLGQSPAVQKGDEESDAPASQLIVVRFLHDLCTISVDTSGALLHRRGYRQATAKAPLRETLAAGLLLAELVADGQTQIDISAFAPDRFAPTEVADYLATTVAQEAAVRRRH